MTEYFPPEESGGGAPTDAPYYTSASDATLTNETVINSNNPLPALSGGNGVSYTNMGPSAAALTGTTVLTKDSPSFVLCDTTGGNFTVTLPAASTCGGKVFNFININTTNSNALTVQRAGSNVINKAETSFAILGNQGASRSVVCDGISRWIAPFGMYGNAGTVNGFAYFRNGGLIDSTGSFTSGAIVVGGPSVSTALANSAGLSLPTAGQGLLIKTGTNCTCGTAALSSGTVTINTTKVTTNSIVFLTHQATAGAVGTLSKGTVVNATSFQANSSNVADTSVIGWWILEQIP